MIAEVADTVLVAIVALSGTVVGGLIAGGVQVLLAKMTRTGQVEILKVQATQDSDRVWLDHRRQIYADFVAATQSALAQILEVTDDSIAARAPEDLPDRDTLLALRYACQLSYAKLSLVARAELNDVAFGVLNYVEEACRLALVDLRPLGRPAEVGHPALVAAMQRELGLGPTPGGLTPSNGERM